MIQAKKLTKIYKNGFKAVDNLNLTIEEGDIYGFLGPNGAGKTTTIRMLTGLLNPSEGEVIINGMKVRENNLEIKKVIGVLPESHGYYDWMTAYEYLIYFYKLFDSKNSNAHQHVTYLLDKVGLSKRSHTLIGQFSRGMKQRLGLAKTLINQPKVVFLDEPTLGLDPTGQRDIHELIKELNRSMNITVFITSHLLKDIEVLCNKVAIVKNGKLIEEDTILNLQQKHSPKEIIHIRTSKDEKAKMIIEKMNLAENVKITEEGIRIILQKDALSDQIKQEIVQSLFLEKLDIYEITKYKTTVEDIFLKLVTDSNEKVVK
ncbi:ABC transporter ATP-binding protein [Clostridium grantii]|uniref:ABC-2 type transport system ATP-binding protein n=1 Tax=Clostridium grantii DSM 8605 TaxID=1121316 RepID=A0A1M5WXB8_9CLOT|nr:ABC transporter ATP-binding protein [Clostridium grantii]SHH92239.1 ABC-2 type transport system ATP-binding protein [Clostridium grantii DSM 8605]